MCRVIAGLFTSVMLTACAVVNPYHGSFMCASALDHGKCESVEQAYEDALKGGDNRGAAYYGDLLDEENPTARSQVKQHSKDHSDKAPPQVVPTAALSGEDRYRDAQYKRLSKVIDQPVTPLVQPPKVLRTLILADGSDQTLRLPRYIMYFADNSKFVIGQYLNPASTVDTLVPNGAH